MTVIINPNQNDPQGIRRNFERIKQYRPTINATADMIGVDGAVENNIATFDASGFPKDSDTSVAGALLKLPVHWLEVSPVFVGNYTNPFNDTVGLTGPYKYGGSACSFAASDGYLSLTGVNSGTTYAYAGDNRGTLLSGIANWNIEIHITDITAYSGNQAGICVAPYPLADTVNFGTTGKSTLFFWYQNVGAHRIGYQDSSSSSVVTASLPSKTTPICVRIEHTIDATNHTLVYKYRVGATGSWTTLATRTIARATYTTWEGLIDFGPWIKAANTTVVGEFDQMSVEYTPAAAPTNYAFIPTASFTVGATTYTKNHVYIQLDDASGDYRDITPQDGAEVKAYGLSYVYDADGDVWEVEYPVPAAHVLATTTALGPLQTVSGLTAGNILRAGSATTAAFGTISLFSANSVVSTGTTNNIPKFGASGQLADAGIAAGNIFLADGTIPLTAQANFGGFGVTNFGPLVGGTTASFSDDITMAEDKHIGLTGALIHFNGASSSVDISNKLSVTDQITSTLAIGTAPLAVTSTTVNTNLNADLLDGNHAAAFEAAGAVATHGALETDIHGVTAAEGVIASTGDITVSKSDLIALLASIMLQNLPVAGTPLDLDNSGVSSAGAIAGATTIAMAGALTGVTTLTTSSDIEETDATKGIILTDTQGTPHRWRLTLDGSGTPGLVWTDLGVA